jgi:hypothetical protein
MSKVSVLGYDTASMDIWFPVFWNHIVVLSSRMEMYKKNGREQANAWIKRDGVNVDWLNNEVTRATGAD